MRVLLDEHLCDVKVDSVGAAIAAASALAQEKGRLIVEVLVDGQSWNGGQTDEELSSARANEVRLTSVEPTDLVCRTFEDASLALADADALQQAAAELLQANQTTPAMEKLNEALSIWSAVRQAVVMGHEVMGGALDLSKGQSADRDAQASMAQIINQLNAQLRAIRAALELGDTVALSDTLLYDLPPVVSEWRGMLIDLQAQLQGRKARIGLEEIR